MRVALLALVLGTLLAGAVSAQRRPPKTVERTYPNRIRVRDVIWGHMLEGAFKEPSGLAWDPEAEELYVADMKNALVGIFDPPGISVFAFGGRGLLVDPRQIQVGPDGTVYVLDSQSSSVKAFSYRGEPLDPIRFPTPGDMEVLGRISAFCLDREGGWYVADAERPRVLAYDSALELRFALPREDDVGSFGRITALATSESGLLAVLDYRATPIQIFDENGRFVSGFGGRDIAAEDFSSPVAVAFDQAGYVYVVDMLRHDVKVFDVEGNYQMSFGGWFSPETAGRSPGEMLYPSGIVVAPGGAIYVSERFGNRVQIFDRQSLDGGEEGAEARER